MKDIMTKKLPQGYGQLVYIDKEWMCGANEINPLLPNIEPTEAAKMYQKMLMVLSDNGYKVITDDDQITEDTFFLSPCFDKNINKDPDEYDSKLESKIDDILTNGPIQKPYAVNFPEKYFPIILPQLPFMLKNVKMNGGKEKYIIRTIDQLKTLKRFYEEGREYIRKDRIAYQKRVNGDLLKGVEFDENGRSKQGWAFYLPDLRELFHNRFIIQSYINTPTEYNTSLRVLASSSGDILCASLKYAETSIITDYENGTFLDEYLANPSSAYFISNEKVVSNTVSGGNSILLGKKIYSREERRILSEHNINPSNATVPHDVWETAIKIATKCKREIGAIFGMDFIYDADFMKWNYLEGHQFPMLSSYAEYKNITYPSIDDYDEFMNTQRLLDINARLQALSLTMQRKIEFNNLDDLKTKVK